LKEDEANQGGTMKTSVIEVRDMLSVLSVLGVEERIGKVPGVESVTVNFAAGNATVRYDETRLEIADIKSAVRQGGYESAAPTADSADHSHEGHTAQDAVPSAPVASTPKPAPTSPAPKFAPDAAAADPTPAAPAGEEHQGKAAAERS
jgi:copper chaperone CopZ